MGQNSMLLREMNNCIMEVVRMAFLAGESKGEGKVVPVLN
jgi:hypothetical protein